MKLARAFLPFVLLASFAFAEEKPPASLETETLTLDTRKVQTNAVSNFPIDIRVMQDKASGKVSSIVITRVREKSEAAELGLQPGDEIVSIDGTAVAGMDPKIDRASQIGLLFLNRRPGDALKLGVVLHRVQAITLHAEIATGI